MADQLRWLPNPFTLTTSTTAKLFLANAYDFGNTFSPDPSTKNGAVLVSHNDEDFVYATNKFPNGIAETRERLEDRSTKYRLVVHAEHGSILKAAKVQMGTIGSVLYCPFYSCSECAKAIIEAGIIKVVGHAQLMARAANHKTWVESIQNGWRMLQEAGVKCCLFNGKLNITARFNQQDIEL